MKFLNLKIIYYRDLKSLSERIHTAGSGKTRLQEATLRILHKDECKRLGAYKNEKNNKTVKVNSKVELCAARVSSRKLPEKWIKVQSPNEENRGEEKKQAYERGTDEGTSTPKTYFYGGMILNLSVLYKLAKLS